MSLLTWVLGLKLRSSARTVYVLNHRVILLVFYLLGDDLDVHKVIYHFSIFTSCVQNLDFSILNTWCFQDFDFNYLTVCCLCGWTAAVAHETESPCLPFSYLHLHSFRRSDHSNPNFILKLFFLPLLSCKSAFYALDTFPLSNVVRKWSPLCRLLFPPGVL